MKFVLSFLLFFQLANASDFSGNVKTYGIARDAIGGGDILNSLQISTKAQYIKAITEKLKFEMSYEIQSETTKPTYHTTPEASYRINDLNLYIHDEKPSNLNKTLLTQNLNRFNINGAFEYFDLSIGRMPIAFGSSKSINPTDVLAPFSISTIDKEERTGVDAIVAKIPINALSLVETGFIAGKDAKSNKSAYYVRPKFNINEYDISFTLMRFKERNLMGFDLQHPIKDAGFWFEGAFVDYDQRFVKDFLRFTTGIDYKFSNSLYLAGEYHYNGASKNNLVLTPIEFNYLKNQDYFILTSNYEFTPLLTGSLQSYYNFKDESIFTSLKLDYNIVENAYLSLGTYRSVGEDHKTEFGRYGQTYYLSGRFYY